MGGAVSSGEDNDALVDNLVESEYIQTEQVENIFRLVDRGFYYTKSIRTSPYRDTAWKDGNLHLSAPCIYSKVLENIDFKPGLSFLNVGSGTGYLNTMAGLFLGKTGVNHGIELHEEVVQYSRIKLESFMKCSHAVDIFEFCKPEFVIGNCLDINSKYYNRYDRVYCGAACPENYLQTIIDLVKVGGHCIIPINDSLVKITRISETAVEKKEILPVSFAVLYINSLQPKESVHLPEFNPMTLSDLCREEIRSLIRKTIPPPDFNQTKEEARKRRKPKRTPRSRVGGRFLTVQRRPRNGRNMGSMSPPNGIVSITCAAALPGMQNNDSDSDDFDDDEFNLIRYTSNAFVRQIVRSQQQQQQGLNNLTREPIRETPGENEGANGIGEVEPSRTDCTEDQSMSEQHEIAEQKETKADEAGGEGSNNVEIHEKDDSGTGQSLESEGGGSGSNERAMDSSEGSNENEEKKRKPRADAPLPPKKCLASTDSDSTDSSEPPRENDSPRRQRVLRIPDRFDSSSEAEVDEDWHPVMTRHYRPPRILDGDDEGDEDGEEEEESGENETKKIPEEEKVVEEIQITNEYSLSFMGKIQMLPLPPALKNFINYNRKSF